MASSTQESSLPSIFLPSVSAHSSGRSFDHSATWSPQRAPVAPKGHSDARGSSAAWNKKKTAGSQQARRWPLGKVSTGERDAGQSAT